jgi:peptide/nickel transport system substrate-binding protein
MELSGGMQKMGKRGRRALALMVAALAMLVIASCGDDEGDGGGGGEARKGGSITISYSSYVDHLDPSAAYTVEAWQVLWNVYTPLLTYKRAEGAEGNELIPGIAESLPEISEDGRTYRLTVRKGLKYSDGTPIRASDFEHVVKRIYNNKGGGESYFDPIQGAPEYSEAGRPNADIPGIEANDQTGEITIRLTEPNNTFSNVLATNFAGMLPKSTPMDLQDSKPPASYGPFKIGRVEPNRSLELVKNTDFNLPDIPPANLDKVTVTINKSLQQQTQDVISGELDYMQETVPPDLLPEVKSKYKDRYEEHTVSSTYYFFMDHKSEPFNDERVRQAANYALDSSAAARIYGGLFTPGCNFLPEGLVGYEKIDPGPWGDPNEPPDLERARQLVEESGKAGMEFTVYGNDEEPSRRLTEYWSDTLNKIGFRTRPEIVEASVYFDTIGNAKTGAKTGFANWFPDFPHPYTYLFLTEGKTIQPIRNQNYSRLDDPEIDRLIQQALRDPDVEATADQWAEADRRIVEGAHEAVYGQRKLSTFVSERIDFENCTLYHPLYYDDYASFCLK